MESGEPGRRPITSEDSAIDIFSAIKHHHMFEPGDKVLVAVSGGPDSAAMLHALHTRSSEFGITLHVAHLNHGIRGEESNSDEVFVRNLAQQYGVPCTIERVDIPTLRSQMRVGEEEAAREVRYRFLQNTAAKISASKIAVGHNADDRAETLLLNIIRGTGIDGLGSIRPIRGNIVRPLIDTPRDQIEAYVKQHQLEFRTDATNLDVTYSRNRIRHELLPLLEQRFNPNVKGALVRLAEIAAEQSEYMASLAVFAVSAMSDKNGINIELLLDQPRALQYQILRLEIERQKGNLKDVSYEQVDRVLEALKAGVDFTITLPSGLIYASRTDNKFRIWRKEELPQIEPFDIPLVVPGTTTIPQIALTLTSEVIESPAPRKLAQDEVLINADVIKGQLRVRKIRPGDKIIPFGMHNPKKLQDVFVDKKIRKRERARAAAVVDDEKILWVAGVIASESTRIESGCRKAIYIRRQQSDICG